MSYSFYTSYKNVETIIYMCDHQSLVPLMTQCFQSFCTVTVCVFETYLLVCFCLSLSGSDRHTHHLKILQTFFL